MSNLVPLNAAQLPAHLRKGNAKQTNTELTTGVTASFPIISYRGKVWRIRKGGEERQFLDANGDPIPSIEIVMVKSNPRPSKTFYGSKFEEGSTEPPKCWSSDGLVPDADVPQKQAASCAACPMNAWGSRISEAGKKGRACADVRRMAVVFADELARKGVDSHVFLMRIPPATLNPLKDYAEKVLGPAGVDYYAVATRVGFDPQASHPKMTFRVATANNAPRFLNEDEYNAVLELRDGKDVAHILSTADELAGAGSTGTEAASGVDTAQNGMAPAPAINTPKAAKPRPVDEEDVPMQHEAAAPAAPAAPAPSTAPLIGELLGDDDQDEPAPPPPAPVAAKPARKPRTPAATAAPQPAATESVTPAPAAPAGKSDFDSILDDLLG